LFLCLLFLRAVNNASDHYHGRATTRTTDVAYTVCEHTRRKTRTDWLYDL